MTYPEALSVLEARQETRIELGLGRVRAVLKRLGDPQEKVPCFHVAGTNGKGSTCAILASVLRASGRKVGLYISPHLISVRERISINGDPIPEKAFARLLSQSLRADKGSRLTYFEILTAVAFLWFAEKKCDVSILETGLGGRLDATNVVTSPLAAIVTSVDYDHQSFLGKTLTKIASQKTGIFKNGRPAVYPNIPVLKKSLHRGISFVVNHPWPLLSVNWRNGTQAFRSPTGDVYSLSLLGSHQGWNLSLAFAALKASGLSVSSSVIRRGLSSVRWPGRFESVHFGRKTLIIDGAHNPQAARALAATWKSSPYSRGSSLWILGIMKDKDTAGVLKPWASSLREAVLVRPPSPRAMEPVDFARAVRRAAPKARVTIERDTATAIAAWRRDPKAPKTAVCAGSLYLAGAALRALGRPA